MEDDPNLMHLLTALAGELVKAQEVERVAMAALNAYTYSGGMDRLRFSELMGAVATAHAETFRIYNEWRDLADRTIAGG